MRQFFLAGAALLLGMRGGQERSPVEVEAVAAWEVPPGASRVMVFGRDGRNLVTAGEDSIRTWELPAGKPLHAHQSGGKIVALSPDGELAAVSSEGSIQTNDPTRIKLVETASGKERRTLDGPPHGVHSLEFSGDQKQLAVGGLSDIRVFDVSTGKEIVKIPGHPYGTTSLSFSPDGKAVAARGHDERIHLWRIESGEELKRFPPVQSENELLSYDAVAISPNGDLLASGEACKGFLKIWEVKTGKEVASFPLGKDAYPSCILFSSDSNLVAFGVRDKAIRMLEIKSGREVSFPGGHKDEVTALAGSAEGSLFASAGKDGMIKLWKLKRP